MSAPGLELVEVMDVPPPPGSSPPPPPPGGKSSLQQVVVTAKPVDFSVTKFIQEGGIGKVFRGEKKKSHTLVAMKFFGYTRVMPHADSVAAEINVMRSLVGIEGVIQLVDVFMDTPQGLIPGRRSAHPYPVIAMELMAGSDLFDRINTRTVISERSLAKLFKSVAIAVNSLHERRYIHRDLKPENLMLSEDAEDSPIKLIDFGMMIQLRPGETLFTESHIKGTPGYYAPESLFSPSEYSAKTDIWQLGCILYSTLSGLMAFGPCAESKDQILQGAYGEMVGYGWENISSAAKDLVAKMLVVDHEARINVAGILDHPWIKTDAPDTSLGPEYKSRVKHLCLRQKLKKFFTECNIVDTNQVRRQRLEEAIPLLSSCGYDHYFGTSAVDFFTKLCKLKKVVLAAMHAQSSGSTTGDKPRKRKKSPSFDQLDFDTYVMAMNQADLPDLGCRQVFGIFDLDGNGSIDLKEFLITLIAFRPAPKCGLSSEESIRNAAALYFNVFDLDDNGFIDIYEMKLVVSCFLLDELEKPCYPQKSISVATGTISPATTDSAAATITTPGSTGDKEVAEDGILHVDSVEGLFEEFDKSKDGQIDFDEFLILYDALLKTTNSRKSIMSLCSY